MDKPLSLMGTPGVGLFALIVIGGLAGWIAGMITGSRHWLLTNILIGIVGSWLGSAVADAAHFTIDGSIDHFLAALVGSCAILFIWQWLHPRAAATAY